MNIVSSLVGVSIMGAAMPMVSNIVLQPVMAQKRANNFAVAESRAVAYAAMNEGAPDLTPNVPDGCDVSQMENTDAYMVTCVYGENKFRQSVTRSFRLAPLEGGNNSGYTAPHAYTPGIFCPLWDPWGVINYNDSHNVQCIPVPYGPWASTYTGEMLW